MRRVARVELVEAVYDRIDEGVVLSNHVIIVGEYARMPCSGAYI